MNAAAGGALQACAAGVGGALPALGEQALLVVSPRGIIEFCSEAARRLFDGEDGNGEGGAGSGAGNGCGAGDGPEGLRLSALLPALPLRDNTPGYNCAYLAFNHPAGRWHVLRAAGREEDEALEVSFLVLPLGDTARILVGLRPALRRQADADFRRFLARLEGEPVAVMITSPEGVVEYVNPAYERLCGWQRQELLGRRRRLATQATAACAGAAVRHSLRRLRDRSGRLLYLDEQVRPFTDRCGHVTHYVSVASDVSARIADHQELERRAHFDHLTGVANRHLLMQRLEQEISRAEREGSSLALICADLDKLKRINDQLGHALGDAAIRAVAARLCGCVRDMDTVGRFGGDEFLLIVPGLRRPEDVDVLLGKLVAAVRSLGGTQGLPVGLSLSAGAAFHPRDGRQAAELLKCADAAMYQAKRRGGDQYWPCAGEEVVLMPEAPAASGAADFMRALPVPQPQPAART